MSLRDRIPVEPLSDERMTNIERNIVVAASDAAQTSRVPARGNTWLGFAVIAAAMIAVGVTSWKLASSDAPAPVVAVESPIHVDTTEGTKLDIGDARLASEPGTKFVVTRPAGGVLVEMTRGKVELEVGKRGTRPPLVVRAGETDVVVVGTRFSVDYGDGTGEVVVIVTEGAVNVRKRSQPESAVRVAIGQAWTTKRGQVAITDLPATQVAAAGSTVTVPLEHADIEIDPAHEAHVPNPPAHTGSHGGSGAGPDEGTGSGSNRPGKKKVVVYEHDPRKALLGAPLQPALDLGIADPRAALMEHMKVAGSGRGDDAARAMYSVAYLQSRVLKDHAAALKTLDIYMARFIKKNRSEHADALWLRVRILCEKTFDDACRRASRIYSEAAPSTNKSGIADSILSTPQ
jgi:hypothetical protein